MKEFLSSLGYSPSSSGLTCCYARPGWPTLHLHPSGLWTCDGHSGDDPAAALALYLGAEYDFWADALDRARKGLASIEEKESEVKSASES